MFFVTSIGTIILTGLFSHPFNYLYNFYTSLTVFCVDFNTQPTENKTLNLLYALRLAKTLTPIFNAINILIE